MKKNKHKKQSQAELNKLDALVANFLVKPVLEAVSKDCKEWKQGVRLLSGGLLKPKAEKKVTEHVKKCSACRLFLLDCLNAQRAFIDNYKSKNPLVADKLSNGKDALVKVYLPSKTRRTIPPAQNVQDDSPEQQEVKKDKRNGKE